MIYALIGILAAAASICIVAAMAADDVDHYTEPEPGPGRGIRVNPDREPW